MSLVQTGKIDPANAKLATMQKDPAFELRTADIKKRDASQKIAKIIKVLAAHLPAKRKNSDPASFDGVKKSMQQLRDYCAVPGAVDVVSGHRQQCDELGARFELYEEKRAAFEQLEGEMQQMLDSIRAKEELTPAEYKSFLGRYREYINVGRSLKPDLVADEDLALVQLFKDLKIVLGPKKPVALESEKEPRKRKREEGDDVQKGSPET